MCKHTPACPGASETRCWTAHVSIDHSEQGWCLLCNGVILFDDGFSWIRMVGSTTSPPEPQVRLRVGVAIQ